MVRIFGGVFLDAHNHLHDLRLGPWREGMIEELSGIVGSAVVNGTREDDWVSMSVPADGSYGVGEGIISSFPCQCTAGEWTIVQGLEVPPFSRERIDASVMELQDERDAVQQLGLI